MAIAINASDIHLRSSQTMGLLARSSFTITCWVNTVWNPGSRRSLVGIYGPTTDVALGTPVTGVQIGTTNGGGELSFWTWGGAVLCGTAANFMNAYNNQWVMTAYTYDGTTNRGYLNGVEVCNGTVLPIVGYLNQVYVNGYPAGTTSEVSAGIVDQYALYARVLSADEVLTIYNAGGARHGISQGMKCRYEFDELAQGVTCSSVPDLSGNGHTLTTFGPGTPITYTYSNSLANSNIRPVQ
jgi:hypothetical protein